MTFLCVINRFSVRSDNEIRPETRRVSNGVSNIFPLLCSLPAAAAPVAYNPVCSADIRSRTCSNLLLHHQPKRKSSEGSPTLHLQEAHKETSQIFSVCATIMFVWELTCQTMEELWNFSFNPAMSVLPSLQTLTCVSHPPTHTPPHLVITLLSISRLLVLSPSNRTLDVDSQGKKGGEA